MEMRGVVTRTRNVSEYMLVLALCLGNIIISANQEVNLMLGICRCASDSDLSRHRCRIFMKFVEWVRLITKITKIDFEHHKLRFLNQLRFFVR